MVEKAICCMRPSIAYVALGHDMLGVRQDIYELFDAPLCPDLLYDSAALDNVQSPAACVLQSAIPFRCMFLASCNYMLLQCICILEAGPDAIFKSDTCIPMGQLASCSTDHRQ